MKKTKLVIAACLLLIISMPAKAQDGIELLDQFFEQYETKGISVAIDSLFSTNKWLESKIDVVSNVKSQLAGSVGLMGDYQGKELIEAKMAADCLMKYTYIVKYERQPLRFVFTLYKSKDKWIMLNFLYNDKFEDDMYRTHMIVPK